MRIKEQHTILTLTDRQEYAFIYSRPRATRFHPPNKKFEDGLCGNLSIHRFPCLGSNKSSCIGWRRPHQATVPNALRLQVECQSQKKKSALSVTEILEIRVRNWTVILGRLTKRVTFPDVIIHGKSLGGLDDFMARKLSRFLSKGRVD